MQFYINDTFPYWRIVSQQGYLINSIYCSKEGQKEKLKSEGVIVKKIGNNERYCVDEFEYCRFDVNNFKITVLINERQHLIMQVLIHNFSNKMNFNLFIIYN